MDKKKIIIISILTIVIVAILATVTICLTNNNKKKLSNLERIKISEFIDEYSGALEEVDTTESSDLDRYISYALFYSLNDENKAKLNAKEIKELIAKVFNVELDEEKIESIGITPYLLNKFIRYDINEHVYELDLSDLRNADIAKIPIIKYQISKITKTKEDKYSVELMKYTVENPYEILNYFNSVEGYDTKDISDYLSGDNTIKVMKDALDLESLSHLTQDGKKININLIVKDNKLLIDSIK